MISFEDFFMQEECDKYNMLQECNAYIKSKDREIKWLENQLQQKENIIKGLNNIINELEKMMKNDLECACSMNENGLFNGAIDILEVYLDKLQELKGSESNE